MENIKLQISDFLGFCDMNGVEALSSEQIVQLEEIISKCNEGMNSGETIVVDAIYDTLVDILRQVKPDSSVIAHIWEEAGGVLDDTDVLLKNNPMYSIQTIKSFECKELQDYVAKLPNQTFQAHLSVKLNGHGIRLIYSKGHFIKARSRARSSQGRDLTKQLITILIKSNLLYIEDIAGYDICEVRGEWLLPMYNLEAARQFNPDIASAFTGVSSMGRDSASEEEWGLLSFVAYEFLAPGEAFNTKEDEYNFLSDLGFEIPIFWLLDDMHKDTLIEELKQQVEDCEAEVTMPGQEYEYYTDGLVFSINNQALFKSLGDDGGHYKFGNMALKVGYWKQDMYTGYVQTILWMKGKTKLSPVAIVAEEPDIIESDAYYVMSQKEIPNYDELGVLTATGNKVRRVPLYELANLVQLDAYKGHVIYFRYGGEAGVVPCFPDGTPLISGKVKEILTDEYPDEMWI